jgi:hypothetical protein
LAQEKMQGDSFIKSTSAGTEWICWMGKEVGSKMSNQEPVFLVKTLYVDKH